MADLPIIDTHLHVGDPGYLRYPWLEDVSMLNKPHLLPDYNRAVGPIQVEKMVFVQAEVDFAQFMDEAAWVTSLTRNDPRLQGMVPWAPLEKGDGARANLEKLADNPLVKGIRRIIYPFTYSCLIRSAKRHGAMLSSPMS